MDIKTIQTSGPTVTAFSERSANAATVAAAAEKAVVPSVQATAIIQQPSVADNAAQVTQAIKSINKSLQDKSQGLEFSIDESDRSIVKVVDQETGDVIRQMPSKEALEIAQALDKAQGLLFKQKA